MGMDEHEFAEIPGLEDDLEEIFGSNEENEIPKKKDATKKCSFKWTDKSIKLLVSLRHNRDKVFSRPHCKKKKLWNDIATRMQLVGGYSLSGEDCHLKYRNMIQTYKKNKKKEQQSGAAAIQWPYFKLFNEVLGKKCAITPPTESIGSSIENPADVNRDESPTMSPETPESPCMNDKIYSKNYDKIGKNTAKQDWKQKFFDLKYKSREAKEERKANEWKEKREIEKQKIEVLKELSDAIKEYNRIRNLELLNN